MTQSVLEFILRTKKQGDEAKGLKLSLTEVASAVSLAKQAFAALQQVINATVTPTVELARQQRDLARASGSTAEEAGALIQVADDLTVSYETINMAAKRANKEGLQLNIETLKTLSDQYNALPDSVSKAQFASDKFGRAAGPEMQKVLAKTRAELDAMAASSKAAGLVLSTQAVNSAREYEIAMDDLDDTLKSAKVLIGQELVPVVTTLAKVTTANLVPALQTAKDWLDRGMESGRELAGVVELLWLEHQEETGAVAEGTAAARAWTLAHQGEIEAARTSTEMLDAHERALAANATATRDNTAAETEERAASDLQKSVWGDATEALAGLNLAEEQRHNLEIALKIASGEMTAEDLARENAVKALTNRMNNHLITQQEWIDQLTQLASGAITAKEAIYGVGGALDAIPSSKTVTIYVQTQSAAAGEVGIGPEGPGPAPAPETGPVGGKMQHGADFIIPPGFNENFPIGPTGGASSGERVIVIPQSSTFNFNGSEASLSAIEAVVRRVMDESGRRADSRRRTRGS